MSDANVHTEGWSLAVGEPDAGCANTRFHWAKALTAEEEDAARAAVAKRATNYAWDRLYLLLHEFEWPGRTSMFDWLRHQLIEKKWLGEENEKLREKLVAAKAALGEERAKPKRAARKKAAKRKS